MLQQNQFNGKKAPDLLNYERFLNSLLKSDRRDCADVVYGHMDRKLPVKSLYQNLFRPSLYRVGELWEQNRISVATEHMATAITEGLMNEIFPKIISSKRVGKRIIIASVEGEMHQVGGKMVADIFEMHGWDSFYVGANTPVRELMRLMEEISPHLLGLSLSVYYHFGALKEMIRKIHQRWPDLQILVGGQALAFNRSEMVSSLPNVLYLDSLDAVEKHLQNH